MRLRNIIAMIAIIAALAGCHRGPRQPRVVVDPELLSITKDQAFERGEDHFNRRKFARARLYYTHVYENYPNDPFGRRSLLRIADTFYEQGDPVSLVEAQYKYRDFINRYPTSDMADYAMLRIAMCSFKQMERPDRDQAKTKEAVEKFDDMLKAFPKSALRAEAEAKRGEALDRLARHEHLVARFYIKRNSFNAALQRLNFLIDTYPQYNDRPGAFYDLGSALSAMGRKAEARLYFERIVSEFPKSDYADRARRRLGEPETASKS